MVPTHSTVRLLHLSDLHGARKTASTSNKWWECRIKRLAGRAGFNAVICSGDIGDNGTKESLCSGFSYLKRVCKLAGGTAHNDIPLILTPGNQDVERPNPNATDRQRTRTRFGNLREAINQSGITCIAPSLTLTGGGHVFAPLRAGIAVVPICTTWVSGDLPPEYKSKLQSLDVTQEAKDKFINVLRTDMPFVRTEDIEALDRGCHNSRTAVGKSQLRIAVVHHSLWALPSVESTYRGFDIVANGMEVASNLQRMGFQLILNGHKHYLGCSLIAGIRNRSGQKAIRVDELLSLSGGQFSDPDDAERFGVQEVEIVRKDDGRRSVSIREYTAGTGYAGLEICKAVITADPGGEDGVSYPGRHSARWVHIRQTETPGICDSLGWHLRCNIVTKLGVPELVDAVDSKVTVINTVAEGDKFLTAAVRSIKEFAAGGGRGVNKAFVERIARRAGSTGTQAMVFVDYSGDGTWGRPDLIENAASLFRVYIERNHDKLTCYLGERSWRHRLHEIETGVSGKLRWPVQSSDVPPLTFDLARILVWSSEALYAPSALVLLNLHKVFRVPLFFVDVQDCRSIHGVHDFHLEWSDTQQEPDGGMYLPETGGRRKVSKRLDRQKDWITVKELLRRAKNPFELTGTKLDWLLR